VELKTLGGKKVNANIIACILPARVTAVNGTLVQLKTGEEVLLENSEEEVVEEMNKFDIETPR
jgi:thermostable 8-oxoguanine DNA glycosylase